MMKQNVKRIISQLVNNLDIPRSGKSLDEDDSWYLTVSNGSYQNVEIRISNHKTDINTWAFRQYRGQSPSTRISIVFRENNYAGNVLLHEPIRRQISVTEYVYDLTDGSTLSDKEIAMLTKAIRAAASGSFVDPLGMATESDVVGKYVTQNTTTTNNGDTVPSTKWNHGMDSSIEESKTNKNMKKNVVKLNENTLRKIVAERVKKILKEQRDCESARKALSLFGIVPVDVEGGRMWLNQENGQYYWKVSEALSELDLSYLDDKYTYNYAAN